MTPAELKVNLERFNEASAAAAGALTDLAIYQTKFPLAEELSAILDRYIGAVAVMVETSSELIDLDHLMRKSAKS